MFLVFSAEEILAKYPTLYDFLKTPNPQQFTQLSGVQEPIYFLSSKEPRFGGYYLLQILAYLNRADHIKAVLANPIRDPGLLGLGTALQASCSSGHKNATEALLSGITPANIDRLTSFFKDSFRLAAQKGHLEILKIFLSDTSLMAKIIAADNQNFILRDAITQTQEAVVKALLENPLIRDNASAGGNAALFLASETQQFDIVQLLLACPYVRPQISGRDQAEKVFRPAVLCKQDELAQQLLSIPQVFAYIEQTSLEDAPEYQPHVQRFISHTLRAQRDHGLTTENPSKAQLYFYILRHLIRQNSPEYLLDIQFLLTLPNIRDLAHAVNNELLRLSMRIRNTQATSLLLRLPEVLRLAQQADFYFLEETQANELRMIARDTESSMHALSEAETGALDAASTYYTPIIEKEGGADIAFNRLYKDLQTLYSMQPAEISSPSIKLPLSGEEFEALKLDQESRSRAYQAYHQHPVHTAYRFLSKPNHWIDPSLGYQWAEFEKYKSLIGLLYRAVIDEQQSPTEGYTLETRRMQFVLALALIGRAHNWDNSRLKKGSTDYEEYDDVTQGDRPSCYSGIKLRLFHAVHGHPLFKVIDKTFIRIALFEFMRQHFREKINEIKSADELQRLKEHLSQYLVTLSNPTADLVALNVSKEKQEAFIQQLKRDHGPIIEHHLPYIQSEFAVTDSEIHAVKFYQCLCKLLEPDPLSGITTLGLFANATAPGTSANRGSVTSPPANLRDKELSP